MKASTTIITLDTLLKEYMLGFETNQESETTEYENIESGQALDTSNKTEQTTETMQPVNKVRPWVRYFARITDVFLYSLLVGLVLGMFAPSVLDLPNAFLTMIILFVWIFQEAILLANCGTTFGKWLFKIKVRNSKGQKLTFSEALNRSFGVWLKGMGAGIPLLNLITLLSSRSKLKHDGVTAWDEEGGFVVTYGRIGMLRSSVFILLLIGFVFLNAWGNMIDEQEAFEFANNTIENQEILTGTEDSVDFNKVAELADKWLENQSDI